MTEKPRLRLVDGRMVPIGVKRLPQPMDATPWKLGSGPRVWTTEAIAALKAANEAHRKGRSRLNYDL